MQILLILSNNFPGKAPAIAFPEDPINISLNTPIRSRHLQPFLREATVVFVYLNTQVVPSEFFGHDGRGSGAVERIKHEIVFA